MQKRKLFAVAFKPGSFLEFDSQSRQIALHLLNASLADDATPGSRATLLCEIEGKKVLVADLRNPGSSFTRLDIPVADRITLLVEGNAELHLVGLQTEILSEVDEYFRDEQELQQLEREEQAQKELEAKKAQEKASNRNTVSRNKGATESERNDSGTPGKGEKMAGHPETIEIEGEDYVEKPALVSERGGGSTQSGAKRKKSKKDSAEKVAPESPKQVNIETEECKVEDQNEGGLGDSEDTQQAAKKKKKSRKQKKGKKRASETSIDGGPNAAVPAKSKKQKTGQDGTSPLKPSSNDNGELIQPQPGTKTQKKQKKRKNKKEKARGVEASAEASTKGGNSVDIDSSSSVAGLKAGSTSDVLKFDNGFTIERLVTVEAGRQAADGNTVAIKYKGVDTKTGKVIDSSKMKVVVGRGEVIKGLDSGLVGMRVGEKRRLTIPPQMGYGVEGVKGHVPRNTTLQFDVELLQLKQKKTG